MKKQYSLFVFAALFFGGVLFHSCQKEEIQHKEKLQEGIDHAEYWLKTTDGGNCNTDCIDLEADPVMYFPKTDQETVQWGGPQGTNNSKVIDLEYYNTETHFVIKFKSSHEPQNLYIDDVWILEHKEIGTWAIHTIELEDGWKACDPIHYDVRVEGSGPPADFDLEYALIGICTTTEIDTDVDIDEPICAGDEVVITGTVSAGGDFTGGIIYIQQVVDDEWDDVAYAYVTEDNKEVEYTYTVETGTAEFRAYYDGVGSNGYNPSESEKIIIEGIDCDDCVIRHETAWADGPRYVEQGNWATYTEFAADDVVNIYAGQTELIGTVIMSMAEAIDSEGNPTGEYFQDLLFELVDGWVLEDVEENVKIQGYMDVPPADNPAPGQFTYKYSLGGITSWGIGFSTEVQYTYFGIHLDVEICE